MVFDHRSSNRKGAVSWKTSGTRTFYRKICMHGYALWLKKKSISWDNSIRIHIQQRERVCVCVWHPHIHFASHKTLKPLPTKRYKKNVVAFKLVGEHARSMLSLFIYNFLGCSIEVIFPFFVSFRFSSSFVCCAIFSFWIAFAPPNFT